MNFDIVKEVNNAKRGNVGSCCRIKDGNGRFARRKDEVRRIWKEYFENTCNIDTQECVSVYICGFDGVQRGNYLGGEPI